MPGEALAAWRARQAACVLLYLVLCASALTLFAFATRHHEALYALPLYEAWIIIGGSISGYSLVHEGAGQPIGNIVGYWLSLCLLLVGLYVLVWWPPIFAQHIGDAIRGASAAVIS